MMMMRTKPN